MARDEQLAEVRRQRIQLLIDQKFGGRNSEFALAIGRSPAQVGHWLSRHRNPNGDTCRHIEVMVSLPRDWLDQESESIPNLDEPPLTQVAHPLSHIPEQTPTLTREQLMTGLGLRGEFWVELWDDAIGQELPKGTQTLWDAGLQPEVGDLVLIRAADGRPHVRVYGESLAHGWQGKPLHSDYEAIPGAGTTVLAVFVSAKVRRSQLRR